MLPAVLIAVLVGVAGLLVVADGLWAEPDDRAREFQHLVGGLGFGPALDLSRCAFSLDPRLCPDCSQNHGPIPGGIYFCPHHACSILYCPPLGEVGPDARLP